MMTNFKTSITVLIAVLSIVSTSLQAQHIAKSPLYLEYAVIGLRGGVNMTMMQGMGKYKDRIPGTDITASPISSSPKIYVDYGLTGQTMFSNQLLLQLDLGLTSLGTSLKDVDTPIGSEYVSSIMDIHLQTRLLIGSKRLIRDSSGTVFLFGVGPYYGFSVGNSSASQYYPINDTGDLDMGEAGNFKNSDYGISAMVGLEFRDFQLTLHYDHGLQNLVYDIYPLRNRGLHLSMAWVIAFGGRE